MKIKDFEIDGKKCTFLLYKNKWVFSVFEIYPDELGSPIALSLYSIKDGEISLYAKVAINIPECVRNAGCQFIDTNNNDSDIVNWLEQSQFGKCTGNNAQSTFCTYPEFDFYKGEKIWEYKQFQEENRSHPNPFSHE